MNTTNEKIVKTEVPKMERREATGIRLETLWQEGGGRPAQRRIWVDYRRGEGCHSLLWQEVDAPWKATEKARKLADMLRLPLTVTQGIMAGLDEREAA